MRWLLRAGIVAALLGLLAPTSAGAKVSTRGWYFPIPFTMSSPTSPHRFGGLELGFATGDAGHAVFFPLISQLTDRANRFIIDMALPLTVGIPDGSNNSFYMGSPRLGLRGTWRFKMPFADGITLPAAWAVGADLDIPLAMIWGANNGYRLTYPTYAHDPVAWRPAFGLRPKAQFALGEPIFFAELEVTLPVEFAVGETDFLVGWGCTLGTQPLDLLSVTLEFGGLHSTTGRFSEGGSTNAVWGALGARFYIGQFVTGLAFRIPFTRAFTVVDSAGSTVDADPTVSMIVFVGYEQRHASLF